MPPSRHVNDTPVPGVRRDFWAWDFSVMPPAPKPSHATLRSCGEHAEIWVDDDEWGKTVQPADVAILDERFNRAAPSGAVDPTRGVFDIDRAYFGDMPHDIDPDPRVAILLTPFATFNGTSLDGYFNSFDQIPDAEAWEKYRQHSNERNMIYLNTAGPPVSGDYMQGVLAHEFSHLLQFGRTQDQSSWLGETLAEVAMAVNGYHTDYRHVERHQTRPASPLESDTYVDYGGAYLFGTFLLERYGQPFIARLAEQSGSGRDAIDKVLRESGAADTFASVVADWAVANYADALGVVAPGHHYASLDLPVPAQSLLTKPADAVEGTLAPTGAAYVRVDVPHGETVHVTADGGRAAIRLLCIDGPHLLVEDVDSSRDVAVPRGGVLALAAIGSEPLHYKVEAARM